MAINQNLMDEIELKRKIIDDNPDEYDKRRKEVIKDLCDRREIFSWFQEYPDIKARVLSGLHEKSTKNLRRIAERGARRLHDAWYYLTTSPDLNKPGVLFIDLLSPQHIKRVAKIIDPKENSIGYRTGEVTLGFPGYPVPKSSEVEDLVEQCLEDLKYSDLYSVEKAAFVHLHIAAIQPFESANKRIARLLQDRVLHEYGLPPAVIHPGERDIYIDVFKEAAIAIEQGTGLTAQRPFYDFIAGKVNTVLDDIIDYMRVNFKIIENTSHDERAI